jgi:hypothetical protein
LHSLIDRGAMSVSLITSNAAQCTNGVDSKAVRAASHFVGGV